MGAGSPLRPRQPDRTQILYLHTLTLCSASKVEKSFLIQGLPCPGGRPHPAWLTRGHAMPSGAGGGTSPGFFLPNL